MRRPLVSAPGALSIAALAFALAPDLPAAVITQNLSANANSIGEFSFGQSVTTPVGGPWNNLAGC